MYSPKISEEVIPILYKIAKQRKQPMTRIVNEILKKAVKNITEKEKSNDKNS